MYLGLYGPSSVIEKLDDDCFGEWIPDDMQFVSNFFERVKGDIWSVTYEDTTQLAYNIVDLMFLNDQYCHFRTTVWDVTNYCKSEGSPCKPEFIMKNL